MLRKISVSYVLIFLYYPSFEQDYIFVHNLHFKTIPVSHKIHFMQAPSLLQDPSFVQDPSFKQDPS